MLNKVLETIDKYHMANNGESLLCCLSGGADSVALLLCLKSLGFSVSACHVNHQLRGEESMRDERFCRELCERLDVPLTVRRIDAKGFSEENGFSLEEGARILRYRIFGECGCDKIATAHTLSDCLETTLFHLARGTGLAGLTAIPPVRGNIIRPLINCRREEIVEFLKSRNQSWVTDSTNLTDDYTRNKIRHNIVPQLAALNSSLEKTYLGTLENLREDNSLLTRFADELYEKSSKWNAFDCSVLLSADNALSGRVFRRILSEQGADCSRERIGELRRLCADGGKITLHSGLYAESKDGLLRIFRETAPAPEFMTAIGIGESCDFFGRSVELVLSENIGKFENVHRKLTNYIADYGKIKGEIILRNRRGGDRIKLIGRNCTSLVKKLFQQGTARSERSRMVILADENGVFFVEGFGFAERVKADSDTKTVLYCKISQNCHNDCLKY